MCVSKWIVHSRAGLLKIVWQKEFNLQKVGYRGSFTWVTEEMS